MHTIHTVIHSKLTDDWPASETVLTGLQKKHAAGPLSPELMFTGVEDGGDYGVSSRPARRPGGGWLEASPSPRGWGGPAEAFPEGVMHAPFGEEFCSRLTEHHGV